MNDAVHRLSALAESLLRTQQSGLQSSVRWTAANPASRGFVAVNLVYKANNIWGRDMLTTRHL